MTVENSNEIVKAFKIIPFGDASAIYKVLGLNFETWLSQLHLSYLLFVMVFALALAFIAACDRLRRDTKAAKAIFVGTYSISSVAKLFALLIFAGYALTALPSPTRLFGCLLIAFYLNFYEIMTTFLDVCYASLCRADERKDEVFVINYAMFRVFWSLIACALLLACWANDGYLYSGGSLVTTLVVSTIMIVVVQGLFLVHSTLSFLNFMKKSGKVAPLSCEVIPTV